ncbi:hypothetical protein ACRRTK_008426 [Alexandromys fortis]
MHKIRKQNLAGSRLLTWRPKALHWLSSRCQEGKVPSAKPTHFFQGKLLLHLHLTSSKFPGGERLGMSWAVCS